MPDDFIVYVYNENQTNITFDKFARKYFIDI